MNPKRKRLFYYSLVLLFIMACRTYACGRDVTVYTSDGQGIGCSSYQEFSDGNRSFGYNCTLYCPGETEAFKFDTPFPDDIILSSHDQLVASYCPQSASSEQQSSSVAPTEPPTEALTEPPTEEISVQPVSILYGKVTYCSI